MRLLRLITGVSRSRSLELRLTIFNFGGGALHAVHDGEQGVPETDDDDDEEEEEEDEDDDDLVLEPVLLEFCDCDLLSSGLLGFSGLPGELGSLGFVPEPPPPISPPPGGPGGQKGHRHEGPCSPNPPVPPFHQRPPGPTMMMAAEMVNLLPSLLVSTL